MQSLKEVSTLVTAPGQLFEMDEVEVRGTRTRVWKHAPPSLRSILEISALHADKTFLVYEDDRLTFEEHFRHAATFLRWRPDKQPSDCRYDQLEVTPAYELDKVFSSGSSGS